MIFTESNNMAKESCGRNIKEELKCAKKRITELKANYEKELRKLDFLVEYARGDVPNTLMDRIIGWQFQKLQYLKLDIKNRTKTIKILKKEKKEKK